MHSRLALILSLALSCSLLAAPPKSEPIPNSAPAASPDTKSSPQRDRKDSSDSNTSDPDSDQEPSDDPEKSEKGAKPRAKGSPTSDAANRASFNLRDAMCKNCNGDGKTLRKRTVAGKRVPGNVQERRQVARDVQCDVCKGNKLEDADTLYKRVGPFVAALANLDEAAEAKAKATRELCRSRLDAVTFLGVSRWAERVNPKALSLASDRDPPLGKPMLVAGRVINDQQDERSRRITISYCGSCSRGADNACRPNLSSCDRCCPACDSSGEPKLAIIENPRIVDSTRGDLILIGGVLDRIEVQRDRVLVLRDGFAVKTPPEKPKR
ncbi:MAG: hypothetical protein SFZ23_13270 [Planctomycetota bacterium]|nr:hypothetical protein [Planctomycetota bacterium]